MHLDRIKALADGVFAIVLTLLILLVEPPPAHEARGQLLDALRDQWHMVAAFVLTFLLVGLYWLNHYGVFHYLRRVNLPLLWLNLVFLLTVAFIPFPTAVLVEYPGDELSFVLYGASHFLCASVLWLLWRYAGRGHLRTEVPADLVKQMGTKLAMPPLLYAVGVAISFVSPGFAIALFAAVPVTHLLMDRTALFPGQEET